MMLNEEAILAMPPEAYMNKQQLDFFKLKLQVLREEVLRNMSATIVSLRETEGQADSADQATQEEVHTLELRTRDHERKLLRKIESSISSIDSGTYGYCEVTGEAIGLQRLIARPTATLSIEAQERHEQRERQFGK